MNNLGEAPHKRRRWENGAGDRPLGQVPTPIVVGAALSWEARFISFDGAGGRKGLESLLRSLRLLGFRPPYRRRHLNFLPIFLKSRKGTQRERAAAMRNLASFSRFSRFGISYEF